MNALQVDTQGSAASATPGVGRRQPGFEPIPGYHLIAPLGQGGFGEVWKCEAPGGLFKAIKFVGGNPGPDGSPPTELSSPASQEWAALERVKSLRHPFILSLERVEIVQGTLIVVMELADQSLHGLHSTYRDRGQVGIPRDELLSYLLEAAEALDWMNFEHGLQHLDVKPHNLFLVTNHVKVADFGLVHHLDETTCLLDHDQPHPLRRQGGITPLYSAPELLRSSLSRHSDQYSLAVVYQQLLTGTVPFWHENVYELMMQHLSGEPDLAALSEEDAGIVRRALAKVPEHRYPSCMEFVQALLGGQGPTLRRSGIWRRMLSGQPSSRQDENRPEPGTLARDPSPTPPPGPAPTPPVPRQHDTPTRRIRALTPAQLAASEIARDALKPAPPEAPGNSRLTSSSLPSPSILGRHASTRPIPDASSETSSAHPNPTSETASSTPSSIGMAAPTAVTLPGFRFLSCINPGQLGDLWRAEDSTGRPRRAMCLLPFLRYDARLIEHLKSVRDPALPSTEVHWSPAERLVILTDWYEGTLRDRFESYVEKGQAGIPREELLGFLRSAAEALDALSVRHGTQHLGLHPRNLLVEGNRLWIGDFGLIPNVWLPTGQTAASLNGRYSAPELFGRRPSRTADQYALALIYAEMLTGIHPRPHRPGSGPLRRATLPAPRAKRGSSLEGARGGPMRAIRLDLDLLPAPDREVMLRALAIDPEERFDSCVAFVEALEQAGKEPPPPRDRYHELPPVIPFATLMGEEVPPDTILPPVGQLVNALTRSGDRRTIQGPLNSRYLVQPDGSWEYRCPMRLIPGKLPLQVEGFRQHWNATMAARDADTYTLLVEVPVARTLWERCTRQVRRVEVKLRVEGGGQPPRLTEARVEVRYQGGEVEQRDRVLATMAPQIFDTIRQYLTPSSEQRVRERLALTAKVHVYPVLPDLDMAPTLQGTCRNISVGGISMRLPANPPTEYLYLNLHESPQALGFAILARVVRAIENEQGWEVGAVFPVPGENM